MNATTALLTHDFEDALAADQLASRKQRVAALRARLFESGMNESAVNLVMLARAECFHYLHTAMACCTHIDVHGGVVVCQGDRGEEFTRRLSRFNAVLPGFSRSLAAIYLERLKGN